MLSLVLPSNTALEGLLLPVRLLIQHWLNFFSYARLSGRNARMGDSSVSYQPPQLHYHYQVPPPLPPRKNITPWILLGVGLGIMLCICSTLYVAGMTSQHQTPTAQASSYTVDTTATAQAHSTLTADDGAPSNPWGYNYEPEVGHYIYNEPPTFCRYFKCAHPFGTPNDGFVVECNDGEYMHNGGGNDACYEHGWVKNALYWH